MENLSYDLIVRAGNGGRESVAWADMLTRMYIHWLEKHDYEHNANWPDHNGSETFRIRIKDPDACVRLQAEVGMHRLVRVSPFDVERRRHTSFAAVSLEAVPSERGGVLRSYVFDPHQVVKDHSSGLEVANAQSVLDGGIDEFIDARVGDGKDSEEESSFEAKLSSSLTNLISGIDNVLNNWESGDLAHAVCVLADRKDQVKRDLGWS